MQVFSSVAVGTQVSMYCDLTEVIFQNEDIRENSAVNIYFPSGLTVPKAYQYQYLCVELEY